MFFFFQAEDGIRDYKVTGVQTCALPIYVCTRRAIDRSATSVEASAHCRSSNASSRGARAASRSTSAPNASEIGRAACREREADSSRGVAREKEKRTEYRPVELSGQGTSS